MLSYTFMPMEMKILEQTSVRLKDTHFTGATYLNMNYGKNFEYISGLI